MTRSKCSIYITILISILFTSCQNSDSKDRFQWEAAMCAPKYYPIGGAKVNFGNAGNSSLTNFDNGWGRSYGAVSSAEKYKKLPKEVFVSYASAVENLVYEGTVPLPYEKIKQLFGKYCKNKETARGKIMVGMAPGGWIRVWVYFFTEDGITGKIEILKYQLEGKEDLTMGEGFRDKTSDYWAKYRLYWKHFGIPLETWAENEKEYDIYFNFNEPNPNYHIGYQYTSRDGTFEFGGDIRRVTSQLPADLVIYWRNNANDSIGYDTHVLLPKNFTKRVRKKKTNSVELQLEIEKNNEYGVLYLITNGDKEKVLRFKSKMKSRNLAVGDSDFSEEVEYFME
ncbi:hypothetical protein IMCC3317_21050 [Kordia antarctica]|uniref:DUF2931 family protein n=1 Tax=Kordia antarctica TaxID=1218801 RepID=A0A7L4ZJE7_9FLAO|nr:DUF2931 family protein [Kordia antarctica]QHI36735.1 hypothetical protein IMCC3317_21050 [Kordia antarctica]